jgi:hypothetical protein
MAVTSRSDHYNVKILPAVRVSTCAPRPIMTTNAWPCTQPVLVGQARMHMLNCTPSTTGGTQSQGLHAAAAAAAAATSPPLSFPTCCCTHVAWDAAHDDTNMWSRCTQPLCCRNSPRPPAHVMACKQPGNHSCRCYCPRHVPCPRSPSLFALPTL